MKIGQFFKMLFGKVKSYLEEVLPVVFDTVVKKQLGEHWPAIQSAVIQIDSLTLSNDEKRKAAFDKIKGHLKTLGKDLSDGLINLGIELAVQYLRKQIR